MDLAGSLIFGTVGDDFTSGTGLLQHSIKFTFVGSLFIIQKGPWPANPNDFAYLGVEFFIGTDSHYGWVHLSACTPDDSTDCSSSSESTTLADLAAADPSTIVIDGYAYETAAGKGICAGQTTEGPCNNGSAVPEPSLLSLLAVGAAGLAAFRARRKNAA